MKKTIITILTLFFFLFLNAQQPLEKRIDFSVKNILVKDALRQLSMEAKISIAYSNKFFSRWKTISLEAKDETIENILSELLATSSVDYQVDQNQIIITRAQPKEKKKFTISGYIEEEGSGERLIAVTIYSPKYGEGTTTNEYGFYSLTLPEGQTELYYRYLGCEEVKEVLQLNKNIEKSIVLEPSLTLSEVIVTTNELIAESEEIYNTNRESIEKLKSMPMLGRGGDLMKQINFLPGVESGVDGLGGTYVRGGNVDQNLTLMDGVSIYNPNHLLGLFSVYNSNAIKSAKLYKGDAPARYGGRISSVLDVRTKEGNTKKYSGEISPGLLSSRLTLEGPILKDKLAFYVTSRFSHLGVYNELVKIAVDEEGLGLNLRFYDINAKLHYAISDKDKLYLSVYSGKDIFTVDDDGTSSRWRTSPDSVFQLNTYSQESKINWGNDILSLRWNHLYNNRLFSNTTLTYSRFDFNFGTLETDTRLENDTLVRYNELFLKYENHISDIGLKIDFDFVHSPKHYLRFGGGILGYYFGYGNEDVSKRIENPDFEIIEPVLDDLFNENGEENQYRAANLYGYIEDEIKLSESLKANVGVRLNLFGNNDGNLYPTIEPRLSAKYLLSKNWSANASIVRNSQFLHLLTNSGFGLPIDIWIPSVDDIRPQSAWQTSLGFQYSNSKKLKFGVEGFYKKMNRLVLLNKSIFQFSELTLEDSTFIQGTGTAYGVEFSLEKEFKKVYAFAYYTLSKSERHFEEFNLGKSFPFQYDRRHSWKLGLNWNATKRFDLGLTWTYYSGSPRIYDDVINSLGDDQIDFEEFFEPGEFNQKRNDPYHRLDIRANWIFQKSYGTHNLGLSFYNAYFRRNASIYERYPNFEPDGTVSSYDEVPISFSPIVIPSFNYSFQF